MPVKLPGGGGEGHLVEHLFSFLMEQHPRAGASIVRGGKTFLPPLLLAPFAMMDDVAINTFLRSFALCLFSSPPPLLWLVFFQQLKK
jgi:hypothetical protein